MPTASARDCSGCPNAESSDAWLYERRSIGTDNADRQATFYSRSRQALWVKGETSGNYLNVKEIVLRFRYDPIKATISGPVCHTGTDTCFGEKNEYSDFLLELETIIKDRKTNPVEGSYTSKLFAEGVNRSPEVGRKQLAHHCGKGFRPRDIEMRPRTMLFHFLILLSKKKINLSEVIDILESRAR